MKMSNNVFNVTVKVPFSTKRQAEIAYDVLRVDSEPKRSNVKKQLSVDDNILIGNFTGESVGHLRVGVNCFFDNINLILETFEFTGAPVSESYAYA